MKERIKSSKLLYYIFHRVKGAVYWLWAMFSEILFSLKQVFIARFNEDCQNIRKLKDSHKGERCFVVATGPSLTIEDLDKLKGEFTISMNSIVNIYDKTDYRPDIYMIQDKVVAEKVFSKISYESKVLVGLGNIGPLCKSCITKSDFRRLFDKNYADLYFLDTADSWFYINFGHSKFKPKFSTKCDIRIYDGSTVTYSAIQLAFYMGFSNVYLVGCDCNYTGTTRHIGEYDKDAVYDKAEQIQRKMTKSYEIALDYAKHNNINFYNATRGGMLEAIPRVNLDKVLNRE